MKVATIALAVTLAGCSTLPPPAPPRRAPAPPSLGTPTINAAVWLDSRFTNREKEAIQEALDTWNETLNGYLHFYIKAEAQRPGADVSIALARTWEDAPVTVDLEVSDDLPTKQEADTVAWVSRVGGGDVHLIVDRMRDNAPDFRKVTLHELGHVLGAFDDFDHKGRLMTWKYGDQTACIDNETITEVAKAHRWDAFNMRENCP